MKFNLLFCFLPILFSCSSSIAVKKGYIGRSSLASTFVGTPDPRQENPPRGETLRVTWRAPLKQNLVMSLDIVFKDLTSVRVFYPIDGRRGSYFYELMEDDFKQKGGILTYQAKIQTLKGEVLRSFTQQLYFDLIPMKDV